MVPLFLHNPLMMPLYQVLIQFAVVGGLLAGEIVGNIGLLEQDVAVVLLIVQNLTNGLYMPHGNRCATALAGHRAAILFNLNL